MQVDNSDGEHISTSSSPQEISSEQEHEEEVLKWCPLVLTQEKIPLIWDQVQQFPQLFDDFTKGDFRKFVQELFNPRNIFLDIGPGIGIAAGFAVRPGLDCVVHLVMFDKRLRGREGTFKEIMGYFFKALNLQRMTSVIADDCRIAIKLAKRVGFKEEGLMRRALMRNGKAIDVHVLGILREEFHATHVSQPTGPTSNDSNTGGENKLPLGETSE